MADKKTTFCYSYSYRLADAECLVDIKFIQTFCSWEPAQWPNMKFPSEMKFMKIYSIKKWEFFVELIENSRVWFMWIWIKLLERSLSFRGTIRVVVKVSRSFNLCTFCLKSLFSSSLIFFDYIFFLCFDLAIREFIFISTISFKAFWYFAFMSGEKCLYYIYVLGSFWTPLCITQRSGRAWYIFSYLLSLVMCFILSFEE